MTARKKYYTFSLFAMVVIGVATGFYFYNKGAINNGNAKAKKADVKIPEVSGTIKQVSKNQVIVF